MERGDLDSGGDVQQVEAIAPKCRVPVRVGKTLEHAVILQEPGHPHPAACFRGAGRLQDIGDPGSAPESYPRSVRREKTGMARMNTAGARNSPELDRHRSNHGNMPTSRWRILREIVTAGSERWRRRTREFKRRAATPSVLCRGYRALKRPATIEGRSATAENGQTPVTGGCRRCDMLRSFRAHNLGMHGWGWQGDSRFAGGGCGRQDRAHARRPVRATAAIEPD